MKRLTLILALAVLGGLGGAAVAVHTLTTPATADTCTNPNC
jgi:hypothetical protein